MSTAISTTLSAEGVQNIVEASKRQNVSAQIRLDTRLTPEAFFNTIVASETESLSLLDCGGDLPIEILVRREIDLTAQVQNSIAKRLAVLWKLGLLVLDEMDDRKKLTPTNKAEIEKQIKEKINIFFIEMQKEIGKHLNAQPFDREEFQKYLQKNYSILSGQIVAIVADGSDVDYSKVKKIFSHLEPYAAWEFDRKPVATVTKIDSQGKEYNNIQIDVPFRMELTKDQKIDIQKMDDNKPPAWFKELSKEEKHWMKNNKEKILKRELSSPPANIRRILGVNNFTRQINIIADENHLPLAREEGIRRHNLSLDIKDKKENERVTQQNAGQLFELAGPNENFEQFWQRTFDALSGRGNLKPKPFVVDIGALSPITKFPFSLAELFSYSNNNTDMRDRQYAAVKARAEQDKNVNYFSINIPINSERNASNGFTDKRNLEENSGIITNVRNIFLALSTVLKDKESADISYSIVQALSGMPINPGKLRACAEKLKKVGQFSQVKNLATGLCALANYIELFQQPNLPDHDNKGLFAAAYLVIAVQCFGGTVTGGCKSAKDRWGLISVLVTAMKEYSIAKDELPVLNKQGNMPKEFVKFFAKSYVSGHQEHMAGMNNPGNEGIQEGRGFLSKRLGETFGYIPMLPKKVKTAADQMTPNYVEVTQVLSKFSKFEPKRPKSFLRILFEKIFQPIYKSTEQSQAESARVIQDSSFVGKAALKRTASLPELKRQEKSSGQNAKDSEGKLLDKYGIDLSVTENKSEEEIPQEKQATKITIKKQS